MKNSFKFLSTALLALGAMVSVSCEKEPTTPPEPEIEMNVTLGTPVPGLREVSIPVRMENVSRYAYAVYAADETIPDAGTLLQQHENFPPESTEFTVAADGLEAGVDYVFVLAAASVEEDEPARSFTAEFTTASYTHVLTILEEGVDHITFHVECGADQYWKYSYFEYYDYQLRREAFWPTDTRLLPNHNTEAMQGPQTITLAQDEGQHLWIRPGGKYIILVAECDAEGNYLYEPAGAAPAPTGDDLISDEYIDDDVVWNGFFGRRLVQAAPAPKTDITTTVEEVKVTTRNAVFRFTPDEEAYVFAAGIISQETYDTAVKYLGEDGLPAYFASFRTYNGPTELSMTGLTEGQYYVVCVTFTDEFGVEQNHQLIPFRRSLQSKPAAVLEVTGIDAPEGESATGPFYCWFNVKAPNKDAQYGTYVTMPYDEFVNKVQYGSSAYDMISSFIDQAQFTPEALEQVNSDEGLNICINAWEDTRYVLVGGIANDEDVITTTVGLNQTPAFEAEPRSVSNLFSSLSGDWTVHATNSTAQQDGSWLEYLKIEAKTHFALSPYMKDVPSVIPEEVYQLYERANVNRNMTDAYFRDFKETAVKMESKYYDRNWIVANSFELGWQTGWGQTWTMSAFESPWGLFTSPTYNGYGNMDIFLDYGPKLFFHVAGDGSLTLKGTANSTPAVSGASGIYLFACDGQANPETGLTLFSDIDFPVEVSEDGNTLTIKPVEKDGHKYYFTLARQQYGGYEIIFFSTKDITITRGWNHESDATVIESLTGESAARMLNGHLAEGQRLTRTMPQHSLPAGFLPTVYQKVECELQNASELLEQRNEFCRPR